MRGQRCPTCDAPAQVEDTDGGRVWWRCWNGHSFPIGEPDTLDEILADINPWPRRIGSTPQ